jgi:hypothetical protein
MAEDTGGLTGSDEDVESPKRQPHPAPAVSGTNIDADSVSGMYIEVGRGEEIEAMKMKAMQAAKAAAAAQAAHAPRKPVAQSLGLDLLSHFTEQERDLLTLPSGDGAGGTSEQAGREADAAQRPLSTVKPEDLSLEQTAHEASALLASQIVSAGAARDGPPRRHPGRHEQLGDNVAFVIATVQKGQDPRYEFTIEELLSLLLAPSWDTSGGPAPCRPLVIEDPDRQVLFREPSRHKRRQKLSVGSIDRWKNSGGKKAVITIPIPPQYQHGMTNVIVQRHGRVLRPDGAPMLRYRQWSFGVRVNDGSPNGLIQEHKTTTEHMLYQVHA